MTKGPADRDATGAERRPGRHCPICEAPAAEAYRPFCSKRCADIDLGRWLKGAYAIPGDAQGPDPDPGETA